MNTKNSNTIFWEDERVDGVDKVTGRAKYTAEHNLPNLAYAVLLPALLQREPLKI